MHSNSDPYQVLGVGTDASTADISRAYRRLARALHPDSQPGGGTAADQFRTVSDAYELLSDPARRTDWDRRHPRLARRPQRPPGRSAPAGWSAAPEVWPLPHAPGHPPHVPSRPRPVLWAGPVHVQPVAGAAAPAGQARPEPTLGDLARLLERLRAQPWELRW